MAVSAILQLLFSLLGRDKEDKKGRITPMQQKLTQEDWNPQGDYNLSYKDRWRYLYGGR